jgi:hypothetical protein
LLPFRAIEDLRQLAGEIGLCVTLLWISRRFCLSPLAERRYAHPELLKNGNDDPLVLVQQRQKQVEVVDDWITRLTRCRDGFVERFAGFDCEAIRIDHGLDRCNVGALNVCQSGGTWLVCSRIKHLRRRLYGFGGFIWIRRIGRQGVNAGVPPPSNGFFVVNNKRIEFWLRFACPAPARDDPPNPDKSAESV